MPKYKPEDLPDFVNMPLEELAQLDGQLSEDETKERVDTALHESAHLLAAIIHGASVTRVELTPPGRSPRDGVGGRVHAAEQLSADGAVISYVGWAWEELHGETWRAAPDLSHGDRLASERGVKESRDDLLDEARRFVRLGEEAIRIVAAVLLATMPRSGTLKGRALGRFVDVFRPTLPKPER